MKRFLPLRSIIVLLMVLFSLGAADLSADSISSLKKDLYKAVGGNDITDAQTVADKLVGMGSQDAAEVMFELASHRNAEKISYEIFQVLLKALAAMDAQECIDYYLKAFSGRNLYARVVAVDMATLMTGDKGVPLILKGLEDKNNSVLQAALKATLKAKPKDAVPVLIDIYTEWSKKKVKDSVFYDIKNTLVQLTHENMKLPQEWEKWWNANKRSFDPKKLDAKGRTARNPELGGDDDPDFFGVPISSKNAVFVIDVSGSMVLVQKDDIPGLTGVSGADQTTVVRKPKEKMTPENERLAKYWSRIWMAKRHLIKVLLGLQTPTKFNVIAFQSKAVPMNKRSMPVSGSRKKKAALWVKNLQTRGNTATLDAIKAAFESDRAVNTIYFLSDGEPSKDGKVKDDTEGILKEVLQLNRFRKIKIHTFGFDPKNMAGMASPDLLKAETFLKSLAKQTGGTYTSMKVDPKETPPPDFR